MTRSSGSDSTNATSAQFQFTIRDLLELTSFVCLALAVSHSCACSLLLTGPFSFALWIGGLGIRGKAPEHLVYFVLGICLVIVLSWLLVTPVRPFRE